MFVAKIHNNSLGSCFEVSSVEKGIEFIQDAAKEQLGRKLTTEEWEMLHDDLELIVDEDPDNIYTWTIGMMEDE